MRNSNYIAFIIATVASLAVAPSPAHGQIVYGRPASGEVQVVYSHWSLENDSSTTEINQFTNPLTGFVPLGDNLEAIIYLANSSNTLKYPNADYKLSGLGDVRLQINGSFSDDRFLLSFGANLPTGKKKLSRSEELPVLQMLSQNFLSFPTRRFGEGFGFNALIGTAQMIGELRFGAGAMYQYNGSYEPYEGTGKYDPGDFISFNAGADWQKGKTTMSGDVIFTSYTSDKVGINKVFKQSTQLDFRLGANYNSRLYGLSGVIDYLLRGRNTLYTVGEDSKIFGDEFWISTRLTRNFQGGWNIGPTAEVKLVGANEQGFESSTILGFGGSIGRRIGEKAGVNVGFTYFTGSADGGAINLTGFQLAANLAANL